jgi:hypothetical protein
MSIDNIIRAFAGIVILVSLVLAHFYSSHWLYVTGFVGLNLLQSAFTGFCPLEMFLKALKKSEVV